jgi:hypothetical protein
VSAIIAARPEWRGISEDEIWSRNFGRNRSVFGTAEHRLKREVVHREVLSFVRAAQRDGFSVVVDATIHESPPEALAEYRAMLIADGIDWHLRVLHPRLEVAIARDADRRSGSLGRASVSALHSKFNGHYIAAECFLDTSAESPETTAARVLSSLSFVPMRLLDSIEPPNKSLERTRER